MADQITIRLTTGQTASGYDFWAACREALQIAGTWLGNSWTTVDDFHIREDADGREIVTLDGIDVGEIAQ